MAHFDAGARLKRRGGLVKAGINSESNEKVSPAN